jgi:hypothetical protein
MNPEAQVAVADLAVTLNAHDTTEALGVIVLQDGSLAVDEMRGFLMLHSLPAIAINTRDDPRTTVHAGA